MKFALSYTPAKQKTNNDFIYFLKLVYSYRLVCAVFSKPHQSVWLNGMKGKKMETQLWTRVYLKICDIIVYTKIREWFDEFQRFINKNDIFVDPSSNNKHHRDNLIERVVNIDYVRLDNIRCIFIEALMCFFLFYFHSFTYPKICLVTKSVPWPMFKKKQNKNIKFYFCLWKRA